LHVGQVCNGATYVNVDVLINEKDGNKMLLVQGTFPALPLVALN